MESYIAIRKEETIQFAMWRDLERIMLKEVKKRSRHRMIALMYDIQRNLVRK